MTSHESEPSIGFAQWLVALLAGAPPSDPRLQGFHGIEPLPASPQDSGCRALPSEPVTVPSLAPSVEPVPPPTVSEEIQAHEAFWAAVPGDQQELIARAWMTLRAIDAAGVTEDERLFGSAAVRAWGVSLIRASGGVR